MWVNELLYILMFAALVTVIVMAVVVNIKLSRMKKLGQKETTPETKPVQAALADTEPELEEPILETSPEKENEIIFEPEYEGEAEPEHEPEPEIEPDPEPYSPPEPELEHAKEFDPIKPLEKEPEDEVPRDEAYSTEEVLFPEEENGGKPERSYFDLRKEPEVGETVDLEIPFYYEIPREDLAKPEDEKSEEQKSEDLWYVHEEAGDEDAKKDDDDGIVICPHCNSQVPKTIYCIYCGNPLKPNPLVEEP